MTVIYSLRRRGGKGSGQPIDFKHILYRNGTQSRRGDPFHSWSLFRPNWGDTRGFSIRDTVHCCPTEKRHTRPTQTRHPVIVLKSPVLLSLYPINETRLRGDANQLYPTDGGGYVRERTSGQVSSSGGTKNGDEERNAGKSDSPYYHGGTTDRSLNVKDNNQRCLGRILGHLTKK